MKKSAYALIAVAILATVAAGCASITKGTSQTITISSNVDGADVFLDGSKVGVTPFTGVVKKNGTSLQVVKEGYRSETITLSKTLEGMFWGNIIIGGTLGSITDFASGAAYAYAPATYQVELRADGQAMNDFERQLVVRKFALLYIDEIATELASGGGAYVSALIELMGDTGTTVSSADVRGALEASRGDQLQFGYAVVGMI